MAAGRRALGPGQTTDLRSLGSQAIFGLLVASPELRLFCQDMLEPLLDYDRRRGRLLPTLAAYLEPPCSRPARPSGWANTATRSSTA